MTPRGPARGARHSPRIAGAPRTGGSVRRRNRPVCPASTRAGREGRGALRAVARVVRSVDRTAFVSGGAGMAGLGRATDALRGQAAIRMGSRVRACDGFVVAARGVTVLRLAHNADARVDGALPAVMRDAVYAARDDRSGTRAQLCTRARRVGRCGAARVRYRKTPSPARPASARRSGTPWRAAPPYPARGGRAAWRAGWRARARGWRRLRWRPLHRRSRSA